MKYRATLETNSWKNAGVYESLSAFPSFPRTLREFKPLYRRQAFVQQWIFIGTSLNYSDLCFDEVPGPSMPQKENLFTFALSQANTDQPLNHSYQENVFNSAWQLHKSPGSCSLQCITGNTSTCLRAHSWEMSYNFILIHYYIMALWTPSKIRVSSSLERFSG